MKPANNAKVDAAYIHLSVSRGPITETAELSDDIFIDYDKEGRPVGVEILNARDILPKKVFRYLKDHRLEPA